jgi:hypothetical protein
LIVSDITAPTEETLHMLYSEARSFVFIAVPKTGTTAIQKRLMQIDPGLHRNRVKTENGDWIDIPTHATAAQVRAEMGARGEVTTFVAFLRDPRAIMVSKYHFYRTGRAARKQGLASGDAGSNGVRFQPARALRVMSALALPLPLWARLYPYSSSAGFVTDDDGKIIVDRLGLTERLQTDVNVIFGDLGYDLADLQMSTQNRTKYDRSAGWNPELAAIVERRLAKDCALYDCVRRGNSTETTRLQEVVC